MRHILSLIGGVVAAPAIWVLLALGQGKSAATVGEWAETGLYDTADLVEPAIYLVVAALIVGALATLRISPVGPLVVGLAYIALYVVLFINPIPLFDALPEWTISDRAIDLGTPLATGTLLVLGVALVIAVFSLDRWRARKVVVAEAPVAPVSPADTMTAAGVGTAVGAGAGWAAASANDDDDLDRAEAVAHEERVEAASEWSAEADRDRETAPPTLSWPAEEPATIPAARTAADDVDDDRVVDPDAPRKGAE